MRNARNGGDKLALVSPVVVYICIARCVALRFPCIVILKKRKEKKNIIFVLHVGTSEIVLTARTTFFFYLNNVLKLTSLITFGLLMCVHRKNEAACCRFKSAPLTQ